MESESLDYLITEGNAIHLAHRPKVDTNRWVYIVSIYGVLIFSITLSISLLTYTSTQKQFEIFLKLIMIVSYFVSSSLLILYIVYLGVNSENTYEMALEQPDIVDGKIIYSLRGEHISAYLKFGVIVMGICSMLHSILESNILSIKSSDCLDVYKMVLSANQISFFFFQILFIVLYNRLVVISNENISKWLFSQVIFIDIMTWASVSLSKVSKLYSIQHYESCNDNQFYKLSAYFIPSVAEFSIVCTAVLYEILLRIGKVSLIVPYEEHRETIRQMIGRNVAGIIFGILSFLITCEVFIIITVANNDFKQIYIMKIHMFEEVFLNLLGLAANFLLFKVTKQFKFSYPYYVSLIDVHLLYVSAYCSIIYCVQIMVSTYYIMSFHINRQDWEEEQLILSFRASSSIIETFNIIVQTYIIQDGFHRCLTTPNLKRRKPGQNVVSCLVGLNFSLWLIKSIQLKKGDVFFNGSYITKAIAEDSNPLTNFFLYFTMPFSILYRFHSSVCLANLFEKMYEDESQRFEMMLRAEGFKSNLDEFKHSRAFSEYNSHDLDNVPKTSVKDIRSLRQSVIHFAKAKKRLEIAKSMNTRVTTKKGFSD